MDCVLSGSLLVVFSLFCYAMCVFFEQINSLSLSVSLSVCFSVEVDCGVRGSACYRDQPMSNEAAWRSGRFDGEATCVANEPCRNLRHLPPPPTLPPPKIATKEKLPP